MNYKEFKQNFNGFQSNGPELYHMWAQGLSVAEAEERLKVRGRVRGEMFRGRGISNINLKYMLVKHTLVFCDRMEARRLSEAQKLFIDGLREAALNLKTPLDT